MFTEALSEYSDENRRIIFSIVGLLVFFRPAVQGIDSALQRQGNVPWAKNKGFTTDLVEKINKLSTFYLLFVYTQLIAKIYGVSGSLSVRYLDVLIFFGFAIILTVARLDAVRSFKKWRTDSDKKRYLRETLVSFGGTWFQIWGLLFVSLLLLVGQFYKPQEIYETAKSAISIVIHALEF